MKKVGLRRFTIAMAAGIAFWAGVSQARPTAKFAFVASGGDNSVVQFKIKGNGRLVANTPASIGAGPFANAIIAVSHLGKFFVYVTNTNGTTVSQYKLGAGGKLIANTPSELDLVTFGPAYIAADPKGQFVYVTSYGREIGQLTVNADGTLTSNSPAVVMAPAGSRTVAPALDATGQFLYVPEFGHNTVLQ